MYQCQDVSFPDARITGFLRTGEELRIEFEGAYFLDDEELGDGALILQHWQKLEVKFFNSETEKWKGVETLRPFELGRLCEVEYVRDGTLELRGFAREAGWWTVWTFKNPQCRVLRGRNLGQ